MPYKIKRKCIYNIDESLSNRKVSSNLTFKNFARALGGLTASVTYGIKSDPGADLVLNFTLGQTVGEIEYVDGLVYDKTGGRSRKQQFNDPLQATKLLKVYDLTEEDVEWANGDAIEKIATHIFKTPQIHNVHQKRKLSKKGNIPYEEGLEFETLANSILSE